MTDTLSTAVLTGVVEGITEFIPVSSTGHLLLTEFALKRPLSELFNIVIQCAAVVAVLPLFRERLAQFLFRWREPETQRYLTRLLAAFVITCVGGVLLKKAGFALPRRAFPIAGALLIGGIAFLLVERRMKNRPASNDVTWTIACAVGLGQLLAGAFPGTSRSGATILLALILGMSRPAATEFSFLVGIPTMLAAGGYEILKSLHHRAAGAPAENWTQLAIACAVSAVVSFAAVKWLLGYVRSHTFVAFGWYRIAVALLILGLLTAGAASDGNTPQTCPPLSATTPIHENP